MKIPMKEKYVDEQIGLLHITYEHPDSDLVDVSDGLGRDFFGLPFDAAVKLCNAHLAFRLAAYKILCE